MKKIMNKDNKGFSLIELIIVIAIMAILIAVIAPNLTKYLSKSKTSTDKKNADEIAAQIQTCITDFETENGSVGPCTINWNGSTATVSGSSDDTNFAKALNSAITSSTESKETKGSYASAKVELKGSDASEGYTIEVTLGSQTVTK